MRYYLVCQVRRGLQMSGIINSWVPGQWYYQLQIWLISLSTFVDQSTQMKLNSKLIPTVRALVLMVQVSQSHVAPLESELRTQECHFRNFPPTIVQNLLWTICALTSAKPKLKNAWACYSSCFLISKLDQTQKLIIQQKREQKKYSYIYRGIVTIN